MKSVLQDLRPMRVMLLLVVVITMIFKPAPVEMIAATRKLIDIPLVVAGGVRTPKAAYETIKAGADIIQVGSAFESCKGDLKEMGKKFKGITDAVKKAGKEKK